MRAGPFWHDGGCVPLMVRSKCWAGHFDLGLDISAEEDLHGG